VLYRCSTSKKKKKNQNNNKKKPLTPLCYVVDLPMCAHRLPGTSRHPVTEERRHAYLGFTIIIALIAFPWKDNSLAFALANLPFKRLWSLSLLGKRKKTFLSIV